MNVDVRVIVHCCSWCGRNYDEYLGPGEEPAPVKPGCGVTVVGWTDGRPYRPGKCWGCSYEPSEEEMVSRPFEEAVA